MKIGIDLGGMSAKIGLCEGDKVIRKTSVPTDENADFSALMSVLKEKVEELAASDSYDFVGISSCGLIDRTKGNVIYSNNIRWENKPFAAEIGKLLRKPVKIANDAKCAALAEATCGAGKDYSRVCMLTIGTGVGGGFVVDGKLSAGSLYADSDGLFGHIAVERNGRVCTCGRRGCLEAYASATAIMKAFRERTGLHMTAKEIFDGAQRGNQLEKEVVEEFIEYLSEGITSIVNVLRPEIVVIGGGVSASADMFLGSVSQRVNKRIFGGELLPVKLVPAMLGNDAGMIGATLLEKTV